MDSFQHYNAVQQICNRPKVMVVLGDVSRFRQDEKLNDNVSVLPFVQVVRQRNDLRSFMFGNLSPLHLTAVFSHFVKCLAKPVEVLRQNLTIRRLTR